MIYKIKIILFIFNRFIYVSSAKAKNQALLVFLALDIARWLKPNGLDCAMASALQVTSQLYCRAD
jgi:hypothetical protein